MYVIHDGGTGSMGSTTDPTVWTGRFWSGKPEGLRRSFQLAAVSFNFYGAATGVADLRLYRQDVRASQYRLERLWYAPSRGIVSAAGDADFWLRVMPTERDLWAFAEDEDLVVTWTNPGTIPWSIHIWME